MQTRLPQRNAPISAYMGGLILLACLFFAVPAWSQCGDGGSGAACGNATGGGDATTAVTTVNTAPLNTWNALSSTGTGQPRWVITGVRRGTVIRFADCTGQDSEITISSPSGGVTQRDADNELNVGLGCTPNGNDESFYYYCTEDGDYTIRLTRHGNCANMNAGTKYLYWNVTSRPCAMTAAYGTNVWNSYVYDAKDLNYPYGYIGSTASWNSLVYDWGAGQPITSGTCGIMCDADNYSTRHLMNRTFTRSFYRFTYSSDDGIRISLDGGATWYVNSWNDNVNSGTFTILLEGNYNLIVDQRENTGGAGVNVDICQMAGDYTIAPNEWHMYVFDDQELEFNKYRGTNTYTPLNFFHGWGAGQPPVSGSLCGLTMDNDYFSVRYTRRENLPTGNYVIRTISDDGMRVSSNGLASWNVFNLWDNNTHDNTSGDIALSGNTDFYFDMREREGGATASFNILKRPDTPTGVTPSLSVSCTPGQAVTLTASGTEGTVYWYSGSCGGTFLGTGNPFVVNPAVTTTYYARNRNYSDAGGGNTLELLSSGCASTTVTLSGPAPTGVSAGNDISICTGSGTTLAGSANTSSPSGTTLFSQNFTGLADGAIPSGWASTDAHWGAIASANAGGTSPEMRFNWNPTTTALFRVRTPLINATSATNLSLSFKHFVDHYQTTYTLRVQTSTDGVNWIDRWNVTPSGNIGALTQTVDLSALNGQQFYIGFVYDGNSFNIDYWYVDDVLLTGTTSTQPTFSWSPAGTLSNPNIANPIATPSATTTYTLTASYNGCSTTDNVLVTVSSPSITGTTTLCAGGSTDLASGEADWTLPTGGTVSISGNERIHRFTGSGTLNAPQAISGARVLVVGGGGGGGSNGGGGGGAGAYIHSTGVSIGAGNTTVTVGAGAACCGSPADNGGNSAFGAITAVGGGGGASRDAGAGGQNGGSGGGGSGASAVPRQLGGAGTAGQGNAGGNGTTPDAGCFSAGGGGGGAGSVGASAGNDVGGTGGAGVQNNITGTALWYAAGGGGGLTGYPGCGGSVASFPGGASGGSGIGGNGESTPGATNTGSGGGAERDGGSGVVIVRYAIPRWTSSNTGVATVNEQTGVVTGVGPGTATITYTSAEGCTASTSVTVNPLPVPSFTTVTPNTNVCRGTEVTYTTQAGQTNYTWAFPGTAGTDYQVVSGGGASNHTATLLWRNAGSGTSVAVGYSNLGCPSALPASSLAVTLPTIASAISTNGQSATCRVNGTQPVDFVSGGNLILKLQATSGQDLGDVTATSYLGALGTVQACGTSSIAQPQFLTAYLGRSWVVQAPSAPANPAVTADLPFTLAELAALSINSATATPANLFDDVNAILNGADLVLSKYTAPGFEDSNPSNNCSPGSSTLVTLPGTGTVLGQRYVRYSFTGFSEWYLHGGGGGGITPLPIELTAFTAECGQNGVRLDWETATEINNEKFVLERSVNLQHWQEVAVLPGAGNSNQPLAYQITDERPLPGLSYYRLTQHDYDGQTETFAPVSVACNLPNDHTLTVYPNPAETQFTVSFTASQSMGETMLELYDMQGKCVLAKNVVAQEGTNQWLLDGTGIRPGTYLVRLTASNLSLTPVRLVIK